MESRSEGDKTGARETRWRRAEEGNRPELRQERRRNGGGLADGLGMGLRDGRIKTRCSVSSSKVWGDGGTMN